MTEDIQIHSEKQQRVVNSKTKITLAGTGIQWGKTLSGAVWLLKQHHEAPKGSNFLVCSPTYKVLNQSTLPPLLRLFDDLGTYNKADAQFNFHGGGSIFMRTGKDPDSVIGITNVKGIWGDEAGKFTLYFWENIQGRSAFMNCPILLTTSPYSLNWIYKQLIKPKREGKREDLTLVQASSIENPYFNQESYHQAKLTMDPRRFNMMFGGEWGRMEGIVYDCFDEDVNVCAPVSLRNVRFVAGVDWGYNPDPFVLVVRAITPDGMHYQVSEFYKIGMTLTDMVRYAQQLKKIYDIQQFYCDPSQPGYIEEFNRNGLSAFGADNEISRGIGLHYELIKSRKYQIFRESSPHTIDELETYHYPEPKDLGPDDNQKEQKPVDQGNHCMDANRYVTIETYRSSVKHVPRTHEEVKDKNETQEMRLKRLMRPSRNSHTESFS